MKLETIFEKFDLFADAPDAVRKMRELVLELAVRGKLVAQETSEKSLTEAQRHGEAFDEKEIPYPKPTGWRWTTLESLGNTKPRNNVADDIKTSFIPMAFIPANYGKKVRHEARLWGEIKKGYTHFQDGDVVMAKITPCFENGKSVVINGLTSGVGAGTTELHVFRRNGTEILPEFVIIFLKSRNYILRGIPHMTGSAGQKRVPYEYFARTPFPLPPLAEQKRIVAKVNELMALCDKLEAEQKEREKKKAALARAALARFAKAPTPDNLALLFYPSPCLRASVRKLKQVSHKGTEAQSPSSFLITPADLRKTILTLAVQGLLVSHNYKPINWQIKKLKDLTTKIGSGSTPLGGKDSYQESGVPLIRSMNVHFTGFVYTGLAFLNAEQAAKLTNVTVKADDVLLNITGASIGRVTTAPKEMEGARVNQHVCIIRPTTEIMPAFLQLFLASAFVQDIINEVQVGATREALTKTMIEQFEIPLPPLPEQRRIVAKVDQLMALVDELEAQLAASRATGEKLLTALVAELTSGKETQAAAQMRPEKS